MFNFGQLTNTMLEVNNRMPSDCTNISQVRNEIDNIDKVVIALLRQRFEYVKEVGTWYLRVYIDKEGGITVDDCEIVNRYLSDKMDEKDFIDDSYILEGSSPGLGRPLKKEKDYARSIGKEVDIKTYKAIDKCKEFTGILKAYDAETVTLADDEDNEFIFDRKNIALIRLAFDF